MLTEFELAKNNIYKRTLNRLYRPRKEMKLHLPKKSRLRSLQARPVRIRKPGCNELSCQPVNLSTRVLQTPIVNGATDVLHGVAPLVINNSGGGYPLGFLHRGV